MMHVMIRATLHEHASRRPVVVFCIFGSAPNCWGIPHSWRCHELSSPLKLTGLGFGGLIGSADLWLADRPAESPVSSVTPPPLLSYSKFPHPPFPSIPRPTPRKPTSNNFLGLLRYTQKAVHTQGGTQKRRSVATAGVMLSRGPRARRYTQMAVLTQGGTHQRRSVATAGVMLFQGPQARRYT